MVVRSKAFPIRIDKQQGQVLHIAYFVFGPQPQFLHRVKATGTGCRSGFEPQNTIVGVFVSPTGR
jgi:hypothetical protein